MQQQNLFEEKTGFVSIDKTKNRYRGYVVKLKKTEPKSITTKWGRVEKMKGTYQPKNETWQGEKEEELPDDLDEFDAVDIYNQICEQRRKRGYVDYSELRF